MKRPRSSGALMGELAITLPLFLLGIYLIVWIGLSFNARASFRLGLNRAVRMATTRGELRNLAPAGGPLKTEIIPDIHAFTEDSTHPLSQHLKDMLFSPGIDPGSGLTFYDTETTQPVFARPLQNMPAAYTYALVYMNESMRQSIGPALRFPCDPDVADRSIGGPGCLKCIFLNPDSNPVDETPYVPPVGSPLVPPQEIVMKCRFLQPNILVDGLRNLIRLVSGHDAVVVPPIEGIAKADFGEAEL